MGRGKIIVLCFLPMLCYGVFHPCLTHKYCISYWISINQINLDFLILNYFLSAQIITRMEISRKKNNFLCISKLESGALQCQMRDLTLSKIRGVGVVLLFRALTLWVPIITPYLNPAGPYHKPFPNPSGQS